MKKLLILMMVVSMASLASAGFTLGVGDIPDVPDSEITLKPSDIITITVNSTGDLSKPVILGLAGPGLMNFDTVQNLVAPDAVPAAIEFPAPNADQGIMFLTAIASIDPISGTWATVEFHCGGEGDVLLTLFDAATGAPGQVLDTLLIHQIPEPMTMALLGLGGLFLRRRK